MNFHCISRLLCAGMLSMGATAALAQDTAALNFIRDTVAFRVTDRFAPNPNNIEIFPDYCIDFQEAPFALGPCRRVSPRGLTYDDFLALLREAYAEGRGGVIDFETPILGPALRAVDRTRHRAFIEQFIRSNPLEPFEAAVRAEFPQLGDNDVLIVATNRQFAAAFAAAEAALLDPGAVIPVVNRRDRGADDASDNPVSERIDFDKLVGLYGPNADVPLVITRGPNYYVEGMLATRANPGARDLNSMVNADYFLNTGVSTYSGGGTAYRPVSGFNSLNSGMLDLLFDPRDNVTALGFVFLTYNNFQYYQGESGVPVNPNNMRVHVEFSDGTSEELAQTSQQSAGNWDVFFGIKAPAGASITRLWCRVIGRNYRTFVAIDDLAFITEPALSYVAGATSFTGSEGAEFYEILQVGQNPRSVAITGLPQGITFDPATGLISGTFAAAGTYTATVRMENAVGVSEEPLVFRVGPALPPEQVLALDPLGPVGVVLNRDLVPVRITSSLDGVVAPGSIAYFARVEKILDSGARVPASLDFLGLTLRDNVLFGKPVSAQQIGTYAVHVFARTDTSAAATTFELSVLAPTRSPNFDSNKTTDFAALREGVLYRALNPETPGDFGRVPLAPVIAGIPAGAKLFPGDFNGNNQTDFVVWDAAGGAVILYQSQPGGAGFNRSVLLDGIPAGSGEQVVAAADFNGDGVTDLLWTNASRKRLSVWLMSGGKILWAGLLDKPAGVPELLFPGDFAGDARTMLLWRRGAGAYALEKIDQFTSLGQIRSTVLEFTLDPDWSPLTLADFNSDGRQDIVWRNTRTGEVTVWEMQGAATATHYLRMSAETGTLVANPGKTLLPAGIDWGVLTALDLNDDQCADLVLRNWQTGDLGVLFLRDQQALAPIRIIGTSRDRIRAAGDFDGDSRADLLVEDAATNAFRIIALPASGALRQQPYVGVPAGAQWISDLIGGDAIARPAADYRWLGGHTFLTNRWLYQFGFGFLNLGAGDPESGAWFLDPVLGWFWTAPQAYPWLFHGQVNFWLYYEPGTSAPRWLFFPGFGWLTEDEFVALFL